jgi:hypothetical protein
MQAVLLASKLQSDTVHFGKVSVFRSSDFDYLSHKLKLIGHYRRWTRIHHALICETIDHFSPSPGETKMIPGQDDLATQTL